MINEIDVNKYAGDSFEEMSIAEMTLVQGSGDMSAEFTPTTPACFASIIYTARASSASCANAISAISSAISGAIISAVKC
ncbi:type 2 lantibiotic [Streptococcus parasanguinis]|uniref:Type 2 lantibiotic n=1 Tax=Streptococcus parasanguinis TaxID=1318 RepID=A0A414CGN6_STRPA|nr:lichenicidin A2 family type 2 lantibiotic [Streptococcus parasanguinis]RHC94141.1 type 2 lantibiotic [Streptococcus parasanguinis]